MRLVGKVAVVTGGAQGIGRATVEKLHAEGAKVVSLDIDAARQTELAATYPQSDRPVLTLPCDVTVEAQVAAALDETRRRFGRIDVLVNNAGVNAYFDATAMTDVRMASFFDKMVKAGVVKPSVDFRKSYTLQFVNKGVGLELRPK